MKDRLDGYRGIRPDAVRKALTKQEQDGAQAPSPYARYVLGVIVEKVMAGFADAEESNMVLTHLIQRAEREAREAMQELLTIGDLRSDEAQAAHMTGRAAALVITWLNEAIRDGNEAARQISSNDEEESQ